MVLQIVALSKVKYLHLDQNYYFFFKVGMVLFIFYALSKGKNIEIIFSALKYQPFVFDLVCHPSNPEHFKSESCHANKKTCQVRVTPLQVQVVESLLFPK